MVFPEYVGGWHDGHRIHAVPNDQRFISLVKLSEPSINYVPGGSTETPEWSEENYSLRKIMMGGSQQILHVWAATKITDRDMSSIVWTSLLSKAGCLEDSRALPS